MFKDKLVLITGASAGIGRRTAVDFAAQGANLIITARRGDLLRKTADEVQKHGREAYVLPCDLADQKDRDRFITTVKTHYGTPDILINNAGYGNYRAFLKESQGEISRMMEVNYQAPAHLMNAFLGDMVGRGSGAVVNVSSGAGRVALPYMAIYCATKFALCALTESVAYELEGTGVNIHLVNPGPVDTGFFQAGVFEGDPPTRKATAEQVSNVIREAIINNRAVSYVPRNRGIKVYLFNLLGSLGKLMVRRKMGHE